MNSEEVDKMLFGSSEMRDHIIADFFFAGLDDICCPEELLDAKHHVEHARELQKKAVAKRNAEIMKKILGQ